MEPRKELKILFWIVAVFAAVFFLPLGSERFMTAIDATLDLAKWYAQEHVVLCLLPAFFIAGVIAVFVKSGVGIEILWSEREEVGILLRCRHFRRHTGGMFLYHLAAVHQYLQAWSRIRSRGGVSLFRSGNQYFIHYPDCPHSWS